METYLLLLMVMSADGRVLGEAVMGEGYSLAQCLAELKAIQLQGRDNRTITFHFGALSPQTATMVYRCKVDPSTGNEGQGLHTPSGSPEQG